MTEEQIKQNAEAYADQFVSRCFCGEWKAVVLYFTAGAHSRDEEFKQWKESKRKLRLRLMQQIHELRNPWISVEERLPENAGKVVIVLTDMGDIFNSFLFRNKRGSLIWNSDKGIGKPIFWMPIPQIEKGE